MKLAPSDIPCREAMLPNYTTFKPGKRGEPALLHEWFYRKASEVSPRWHSCDPLVCRECNRRRRAEACADPQPMA